jgi:heme oxygenase
METAADHRAAEESLPLMSETLHAGLYVTYITKIHSFVSTWEDIAAQSSPGWLQPTLHARQRSSMLERDLAWFHAPLAHTVQPTLPLFRTEASLLGAMYVMEGSTLGGQLISRHVTRVLGLTEGHGDSFFRGHGDRTGILWKEFCEVLRTRVPDADTEIVVHAARTMFQLFSAWMKQPQHERRAVA